MEVRVVAGVRATNRAGAAEYLGRSLQTVHLWASPARRAAVGWPDPLATVDGQHWYALEALDRFRAGYLGPVEAAGRARVHRATPAGDPQELITAAEFRALLRVGYGTWARWVWQSRPAWDRGADGYLPRPDEERPARRGTTRRWLRGRVVDWVNSRRGKVPGPGRPPRAGQGGQPEPRP